MLEYLFGSAGFVPHGYCLLWRPDLVAMHVGGDLIVFLAYTAISVAIWRFMRMRPEFRFNRVALLFAAFVFGCGVTHLFGAVALWWPAYGAQAILKLAVAAISVIAAVAIWQALPAIAKYPTYSELKVQRRRLRQALAEQRKSKASAIAREKVQKELLRHSDELTSALGRAKAAEIAKARFVAAMSHDLRTPLNAILGFTDALRLGVAAAAGRVREEEYFEHIHSSASHLLSMINDLLDLSRFESGVAPSAPEYMDVRDLVEEVLEEARADGQNASLTFRLAADSGPMTAFADPVAVRRIITNVIGNASKYCVSGGNVDVAIREEAERLRISVIDDGPGFPPESVEQMRQPFVQRDARRGGIGLGLAIVDMLLKSQNGTLRLKNAPDRGAMATFTLPRYAPEIQETPPVRTMEQGIGTACEAVAETVREGLAGRIKVAQCFSRLHSEDREDHGMTAIGFIGVGNMGAGMARNLLKAGHAVTVFDLDTAKAQALVADGATVAASAQEAAAGATAVITMLPNGAIARKVYGDDVIGHATPGALLIDCSTIDVESARALAADAAGAGHMMLDAPVSGGVSGAEAGTLAFMIGGPAEAFSLAKNLFDAMGAKAVHCGEAGAGQATKICNNMMLAIQMISVAEGFVLAEKLGVAPQTLFDVSSAASAQCWSLTTYCPVAGVGPETSADRGFAPGFAAALMDKDLKLAMEAAAASGANPAFGKAAAAAYDAMVADGEGGVDFSGIINRVRAASS